MKLMIKTSVMAIFLILTACSSKTEESVQESFSRKEMKQSYSPSAEMTLMEEKKEVRRAKKGVLATAPTSILNQTFFVESEYAKERYLAYFISLKYLSDDFRKSRETLMSVLEKYGYPVKSRLVVENNRLIQRAEIKIKTDSLFKALEILNDAGVLVEETIDVTDYSSRVNVRSVNVQQNERGVAVESQTKSLKGIKNNSIREQVEWANIVITIEGSEPVYFKVDKNSFDGSLDHVKRQIAMVFHFLLKNILWIILFGGIFAGVRKVVKSVREKQ